MNSFRFIYLSICLLILGCGSNSETTPESTDTKELARNLGEVRQVFNLTDGSQFHVTTLYDSTLILEGRYPAQQEFFSRIFPDSSNQPVHNRKKNILEILTGEYPQLDIVEGQFEIQKTCIGNIPKIVISADEQQQFMLSYYRDSLLMCKQIISSSFAFSQHPNLNSITQGYDGEYIQFWLQDTTSELIDSEFSVIGSAGHDGVLEFHISGKPTNGLLFLNGNKSATIKLDTIVKECD